MGEVFEWLVCTRDRPGEVSSKEFHDPWRALKLSDSEDGSRDLDPVTASEVPDARSSSSWKTSVSVQKQHEDHWTDFVLDHYLVSRSSTHFQ